MDRRKAPLRNAGLLFAFLPALAVFALEKPAPALSSEHRDASGSFSFRTPAAWTVEDVRADRTEASGDGLVVRFFHHREATGFDSLHVSCMQDRLAGAMESDVKVDYEYDFQEGVLGAGRVLDSAFRTRYDKPVKGYRDWRQRNVTLVGSGRSLCIIAYCPVPLWKKSRELRALLDGVVMSVSAR